MDNEESRGRGVGVRRLKALLHLLRQAAHEVGEDLAAQRAVQALPGLTIVIPRRTLPSTMACGVTVPLI